MHIYSIVLCNAACIVYKPDNVHVAGTAWLRNTEPFDNRKGTDYKIQNSCSTSPVIMRQLRLLTLAMQIAALQQKVCQTTLLLFTLVKSCWSLLQAVMMLAAAMYMTYRLSQLTLCAG